MASVASREVRVSLTLTSKYDAADGSYGLDQI